MRLVFLVICTALIVFLSTEGCSDRKLTAAEEIVAARAQHALEAWQKEDWPEMYAILSARDKSAMSLANFVAERQSIEQSRSLKSFSIDNLRRSAEGVYIVEVTLKIEKDYNARLDTGLENKIEIVSTEWRFVQDQGTLALTFLNH